MALSARALEACRSTRPTTAPDPRPVQRIPARAAGRQPDALPVRRGGLESPRPWRAVHRAALRFPLLPGAPRDPQRDRPERRRLRRQGGPAARRGGDPSGYVSTHVLLGTSPAGMTVPRMGLHWVDTSRPSCRRRTCRSPHVHRGIVGRAGDLRRADGDPRLHPRSTVRPRHGRGDPVPAARRYVPAGFYPVSYGIRWDEAAGNTGSRSRG